MIMQDLVHQPAGVNRSAGAGYATASGSDVDRRSPE
jgi:hypothetical protein